MGGLFGGTVKAGKPQYTGIQIQTSASTLPVPIIWGMNRAGPNLIWYGDFKANKKKQKTGKGGGQKTEYYTYSASLAMSLCEGPINGINKAYIDQSEQSETSFADTGYTLFTGTDPQSPWGYLSSRHPSEALSYAGIAYIAIANYDLGQAASLPQHNFEVKGLRYGSAQIGLDADSALIINDFLTDEQFGVGFNPSMIDYDQLLSGPNASTTGDSSFQTYCRSMGFAMSPVLSSQEQASSTLDRWAKLMNSAIVWNGEQLKFIPYGDEAQTGGGVTYIPNTAIRYRLTDADYVGGSEDSDPITMNRSDPSEAYNSFKIEINDRGNQYNGAPVEWRDPNLVELYGLRPEGSMRASEITRLDMASRIVALMGQRGAYIRNHFNLGASNAFVRLEPMDIITLYDPAWGEVPVRVVEVTEQDDGNLELLVEEFPEGVASTSGFGTQGNSGGGQNQASPPGPVNPPIIWEPPLSMTSLQPQIWAAVSGGDGTTYGPYWGGANVWLSLDNVTYQQVGVIDSPARMGKLTAPLAAYPGINPDNANTLSVTLLESNGDLISVSAVDAQNEVTLCYVDGEYLSYQDADLTGAAEYDIEKMYRGLRGSTPGSHAAGSTFARLDENIFKLDLQLGYIGQVVYIKLQSFNLWGAATEDLSTCAVYTFTPTGGGIPDAPTTLTAAGGYQQAALQWTAMGVSSYRVYAYHGVSTNFADATLLATVTTPNYLHFGLADGDAWTYWVTSVTIGGESAPTGPQTITTAVP
ncbi:tip attachment protein [Brevundimonas phage vB_BpoS-Polewnik]|nr:tip attachment protein [Brevundimonas phage vB_BpoS-Polewnik]